MEKLFNGIKNWYKASNEKWHEEQRQELRKEQQKRDEMRRMQIDSMEAEYLLFFRHVLGKISWLNTVSMQCNVVAVRDDETRLVLQIQPTVGNLTKQYSLSAMGKIIQHVLHAECLQEQRMLMRQKQQLQMMWETLEQMGAHNDNVMDKSCYFMNYAVKVAEIDNFKITILVRSRLNLQLQCQHCYFL